MKYFIFLIIINMEMIMNEREYFKSGNLYVGGIYISYVVSF